MEPKERLITFLFPQKNLCNEKEMYFRDELDNCVIGENSLSIPAYGQTSFDTYFNSFDYGVFRRATNIENVSFTLKLQGDLRVVISHCYVENDGKTKSTEKYLLHQTLFQSKEPTEISIDVSIANLPENGILYVELYSQKGGKFYGGHIDTTVPPINKKAKIGIVIPTFQRETFIKKNVQTLVKELPKDSFGIFVIDNGQTLCQDDVQGATLIPNKNLGGAGGFTRGIMELLKRNREYTHALLTDDDIRFHPEIFLRTLALVRYATNPKKIIIGSSMLLLNKPYLQHEMGSVWTGYHIHENHHQKDVRKLDTVLNNTIPQKADYCAWWFSCFSLSLPKKHGLPFPFFIKIDDVEYGMRLGCEFVFANGIGVWHESFDYKFSASLEYYTKRNELILNALHRPDLGILFHFYYLARCVTKQIVFQRYKTLDLVFKAFDDFLKGADAFMNTDALALNESLSERGEKMLSPAELKAQGFDLSRPFYQPQRKKSLLHRIIVSLTLNGYLLPAKREDYRITNLLYVSPNRFFRARTVVQYNPLTKMGFVTKQSRLVLIKTGFRLIGYFFKTLFKFRKAARSFRERFGDIVSEQAWKERLEIKE